MLLLAGYWLARSVDISWSVEISVAAVCTSMFKLLFCVGQNWVSRPLSADGAGAGSRQNPNILHLPVLHLPSRIFSKTST